MALRHLALLQLDKRKLESVRYCAQGACLRTRGGPVQIQEMDSAPFGFTRVLGCQGSSRLSRGGRWGFSVETFSPELLIVNLLFPLEKLKSTYDLTGKPRLWGNSAMLSV